MDDLTDLWLVDTENLDATDLDVLLDNLETIEGTDTEGALYVSRADFDAFNAAGGGLLAAWDAEPPLLWADIDPRKGRAWSRAEEKKARKSTP